eukprot:897134-Pyramimonas_sp.AAC.1
MSRLRVKLSGPSLQYYYENNWGQLWMKTEKRVFFGVVQLMLEKAPSMCFKVRRARKELYEAPGGKLVD